MKLMVSVGVKPLKSSEISALPEGAEQELSPPASYPGHHWQINSALLWIWCPYRLQRWFHLEVELVSLETISLSYRDLLCQTKSPGIGSNKCRGVGQSV